MSTASTSVPAEESTKLAPSAPLPVSMLVVTCLVAIAFMPLIMAHVVHLWARPHYQFFPVLFVGAGILAYVRFPGVASLRAGAAIGSWCLLGFTWLVLAAAELLNSGYLAAVAALFLLLAAMWAAGGFALVRRLLPAWLFLWLIIPPPFGLDNALVLALQRLTTQWSSSLLDQFRVFHVITGNVVEVGGRRLFVDEACAGINSLFSVLACAIFYVLFMRAGLIRSVLLILAAVSWVLLANVVRVFLVAFSASRSGPDLTEGWRHDTLGFVLFAVALGLIWSSDRLLLFLTPARWRRSDAGPTNAPQPVEETDRSAAIAGLRGSWLNSWIAGVAFGLLLAFHVALYTIPDTALATSVKLDLSKIDEATLPDRLDGWRLDKSTKETRDTGSAFGQFSQVWFFRGDSQGAAISFDYPFAYWHELEKCYKGHGWEVEGQTDRVTQMEGAPSFYSQRTMKKAGVRHGHLLYCEFDQTGHVMEPDRGVGATLRSHESALGRWLTLNQKAGNETHRVVPPVYQFQMWIESDAPLRSSDADAAQVRFFKAYQTLHKKLFD